MPPDRIDDRPVVDASALLAYAELAPRRWERRGGLSLADRVCLALADRLGVVAWTADTAWGDGDAVHS